MPEDRADVPEPQLFKNETGNKKTFEKMLLLLCNPENRFSDTGYILKEA